MFVQVIEGVVGDRGRLERQLESWNTNVRPDAVGFLGCTAGVGANDRGVVIVRFASADAARANSDRPEQGAWWAATQPCFRGAVSFRDSTDVETFYDFGEACAAAGFVQVIQARVRNRGRLAALEDASLDAIRATRPSLIGGLRCWDGDRFVQAVYFHDEAGARREEAAGVPVAVAGAFAEWQQLCEETRFLDLTAPWLF
jgi:hypothetical protein